MSGILLVPFRLIRLPFSITKLLILGIRRRRHRFALPVAGLEEAKAQSIYFALQRASSTEHEQHIVKTWLQALQIAQVASGRLLVELYTLDANLRFWNNRLQQGGHFWFALFRRGPLAFFERIFQLCTKHLPGNVFSAGGDGHQAESYDASLVEARVLLFRVLRAELCDAVADVHAAAALLYLKDETYVHEDQEGGGEHYGGGGMDTPMGKGGVQGEKIGRVGDEDAYVLQDQKEETLFGRTERAVNRCLTDIVEAFERMKSKVDDVIKTQSLHERPINDEERAAFSHTLLRALGIDRLRRVWTQHDVTVQPSPFGVTPISRRLQSFKDDELAVELLDHAQSIVGFRQGNTDEDMTVHVALKIAREQCDILQREKPIIRLPRWMLMPSSAQQHWVRYTMLGAGLMYVGIFIIKHSPLCGSKDLENWVISAGKSVKAAWSAHVVSPLENVQGELFNTFRRRPSIVSLEEYEADRDSLKRMLEEFNRDAQKKGKTAVRGGNVSSTMTAAPSPAADDGLLGSMEVMMHCYENELKRPIRNLVAGDLMRSLLIQVQKMKVDTESAMLEIDQILKANELSISLVAAIPAFILGGVSLYFLDRFLTPAPPDPRREAVAARLAMIDVERALEALVPTQTSGLVPTKQVGATEEEFGEFWYRLAVAFDETEDLYARHKGILRLHTANEEWNQLRQDMLSLASPAATELKLRSAARMLRVYSIYQR